MSTSFTNKDLDRTTFLNATVSGDTNAWKVIRCVLEFMVIGIARNKGLSAEIADAALADAIAKARSHIETFEKRGEGSFRGWLRFIIRNSVIDIQRKEGREPVNRRSLPVHDTSEGEPRTVTAERIPDTDSPEFGARLDCETEKALLLRAIQKLRSKKSFKFQVATLAFVKLNTTEEIAAILNQPKRRVAVWRSRASNDLKNEVAALKAAICREIGGVW